MSAKNTAGLYFLQPVTTINGIKYLDLFKEKLDIVVHDCNVFIHDGAMSHATDQSWFKNQKTIFRNKHADILDWLRNNPDINLIENLRHIMKNMADQHPTSFKLLKRAIKIVWTQKITLVCCCNLVDL